MFEVIFKEFGINTNASVKPFGSGLINNTWLISENEMILFFNGSITMYLNNLLILPLISG